MKRLSILGSTGSIGRNTLEIASLFPERFKITALTAKTGVELLSKQIDRFRPKVAVVYDEESKEKLKALTKGTGVHILCGEEGYMEAAANDEVDMVVTALVGAAGLKPTLAAIEAGKDIALANKETLVMAGDIVMKRAAEKEVKILPVDSEHSAIFQCLSGQRRRDLHKILLTASGGPFRKTPKEEFATITPEMALNHPTWSMGPKISIDSATMMNKGLEIIEAKWLFSLELEEIEVLIHPQSIVHSMVAYKDGSVLAQLGVPDMKGAIAYALSWPERMDIKQPAPDFARLGALTFESPDTAKFRCIALAFTACQRGGIYPAVMNAANEVAVQGFLDKKISFTDIPGIIEKVMNIPSEDDKKSARNPDLERIILADKEARLQAHDLVMG